MIKRSKVPRARIACVVLFLLATSIAALGQEQPLRIKYWLAMSHPSSHLFEVTVEVGLPADTKIGSLDFQMPKWSPGRYAVFDFAKNVQEVKARPACPAGLDCSLPNLTVTRVDDQTWRAEVGDISSAGMSVFSRILFTFEAASLVMTPNPTLPA